MTYKIILRDIYLHIYTYTTINGKEPRFEKEQRVIYGIIVREERK